MAISRYHSQLLSLCKPALVIWLFDKGCDMTGKMTLLYTVYTKPRWWACVWVCLFFRPYPELPYLLRPSLCWLSFSSSSLSDQTSSWPFCRHGGSVLLLQQTAVNTPTQNDLAAAKYIWCRRQFTITIIQCRKNYVNFLCKRIKFHLFLTTWTNIFAGNFTDSKVRVQYLTWKLKYFQLLCIKTADF